MIVSKIQLEKQDFKTIEELILKDFEKKLRVEGCKFSFSLDNQSNINKLSGDITKFENPFNLNISLECDFDGYIDYDSISFVGGGIIIKIIDENIGSELEWFEYTDILYGKLCDNIKLRLEEILL